LIDARSVQEKLIESHLDVSNPLIAKRILENRMIDETIKAIVRDNKYNRKVLDANQG
jgi:hypothetical protein